MINFYIYLWYWLFFPSVWNFKIFINIPNPSSNKTEQKEPVSETTCTHPISPGLTEYDFYRRYGKRAFASCSQMLLHGQSYGREVKRGSKVFIQQNQKQFGIHSHANTNAPSLGGTNYFPFHLMLRLVILYPLIKHMNSCIQSCSKQRHVSKAL